MVGYLRKRLVKDVSPTSHKGRIKIPQRKGYFTQEKYLIGMNAQQIETALGLRPFGLRYICYIYSLQRLPKVNEIEFRYTCDLPDGMAFGKAQFEQAMAARDDFEKARNLYTRSQTPIAQFYQTGESHTLSHDSKVISNVTLQSVLQTDVHAVQSLTILANEISANKTIY